MDPITLARLWIAIRPFKRLRERREAKRAQAALSTASDHATVPSPEDAVLAMGGVTSLQGDGMSELMKSMGRSALKIVGTALTTYATAHGLIDIGAGDAFTAALEAAGGAIITILGLYLSHRKHSVA